MRRLALAAAAGLASACLGAPAETRLPRADAPAPASVRVRFVERGATVVRDVPIEDYVRATAISEFAPAAGEPGTVEQMLEVQAIISRTYAVSHRGRHARDGFDLCATTHCQLFDPDRLRTSRWAAAATEAVSRTAGSVLRFEGRPAQTLFHADCGGHTSAAAAVWGGPSLAYLVARADGDVAETAHVRWEYRASVSAVGDALEADERTRVTGSIDSIEITSRDDAGRAQRVSIRSTGSSRGAGSQLTVRGEDFRQALSRAFGPRSIRSTWLEVRRDREGYVFSGRGFGHGVGLCQAGALARLQAGAKPSEVLRYYYPGTSLR